MKRLEIKKVSETEVTLTVTGQELFCIQRALELYCDVVEKIDGFNERADQFGRMSDDITDFMENVK